MSNQTTMCFDPPDGFEPQEHSIAMRDTSEEAFAVIKEEGLLSTMRMAVYEHLYLHGPLTGAELDERMRRAGGRGHYHKRLSELKRVGVAREVDQRPCTVTGRVAYVWDVTAALPNEEPPAGPKRLSEAARRVNAALERGYAIAGFDENGELWLWDAKYSRLFRDGDPRDRAPCRDLRRAVELVLRKEVP